MALDPNTRRSIQHDMGLRSLDGQDVGRARRVEGDFLKVVANDGNEGWLPDDLVARVDQYVHLDVTAADLLANWRDADPNVGERNDLHERHERSDVKGERHHEVHEQRNEKR